MMDKPGVFKMMMGAIIFFVGVIITYGTYAGGGNTVIIAYGAIIVGLVELIFGALQYKIFKDQSDSQRSG